MTGFCVHKDEGKDRYRIAFEHMGLGAWFCDPEMRILEVNPALCEMLGRSCEELIGRSFAEFVSADQAVAHAEGAAALLRGDLSSFARETQLLSPDGSIIWALLVMSVASGIRDTPSYLFGNVTDLTDHHRREERLQHLADHDALTEVLNRRGFGRELRRHLSRLARYGAEVGALLMLDLDNFKAYNDAHGHVGGDVLLKDLAGALNARLRMGDIIGRIGGDEFAILLPEATPEQAEVVAAALRQAVRELGQASKPPVTASVGIFPFDHHEHTLSEHNAMIGADQAMYSAKHAGRDLQACRALISTAAPHSKPEHPNRIQH